MSILFPSDSSVDLSRVPNTSAVEWTPVERKLIGKFLVRNAVWSVFLIPLFLGFEILEAIFTSVPSLRDLTLIRTIASVGVAWLILYWLYRSFVYPFLDVPRRAYAIREEDVNEKRGVLSKQTASAPFSRMQGAQTKRDVFDRCFGLASLQIFTVGNSLTIDGLTQSQAESMKDHILRMTSTRTESISLDRNSE